MDNKKRNRRRYKVRYDRIFAAVLMLIVLIVLITSCSKGCSDDDKTETSKSDSSNSSQLTTDDFESPVTDAAQTGTQEASQTVSDSGFTNISVEAAQVGNGDLIVVNPLHEYKFQTGDTNLVTLYDHINEFYKVKDNILMLDENVVNQLNALMAAYASNPDLNIINGYRTLEEQNDKYSSALSKIPGGYSDFHTGRLIEIGIFPEGQDSYFYSADGDYAWFAQNAPNYGFTLRYPQGKESITGDESRGYAYRYVGIPHAIYMTQNNLCLEEYVEQLKTYTNTNPLKITNGTSEYEVYYVAQNTTANAPTDVPVPSSRPYTISGNNIDGFIITVTNS